MTRQKRRRPPEEITLDVAKRFFDQLDDNEEMMGEGAALAVTLEQFGYDSFDMDVLVDMAEAAEAAKPPKAKQKGTTR